MLCLFLTPDSFSSAVELRQAIVAMMNRKDELEEQNTYVGIFSSGLARARTSTVAVVRRYLMTSLYEMVVADSWWTRSQSKWQLSERRKSQCDFYTPKFLTEMCFFFLIGEVCVRGICMTETCVQSVTRNPINEEESSIFTLIFALYRRVATRLPG